MLKPTITAPEAAARSTSVSVISPGAEQHPHLHFALGQLFQGAEDRLDAALHIGLEDQVEFLELAFAGLARHRGQGHPAGGHLLGQAGGPGLVGPVAHHGAGGLLVGIHLKLVPGGGHFAEAEGFDRIGGGGFLDPFAAVIHHGPHLAEHRTGRQHVAGPQGAVLHQQGGHRTLGLVEVGLDHGAAGHAIRVGLEVFHLRDQQDHLQQLVDVLTLDGADRHHHGVATPVFCHQFEGRELLLDAVGEAPLCRSC